MNEPDFRSGFTEEISSKYGIDSNLLIIEVTEQNAIHDMDSFVSSIEHYRKQGFKIAIDDFGSGYSGFSRVCSFSPEYVKIDMGLIRNIHIDPLKQAAVEAIVSFCQQTEIKVIAEGIEKEEELKTVIRLGVDYGQGYYLCLPKTKFASLSCCLRKYICDSSDEKYNWVNSKKFSTIGEIGMPGFSVNEKMSLSFLYKMVTYRNDISDYFIINNEKHVCGIVKRSIVSKSFRKQLACPLSKKVILKDIMSDEVLVVDERIPIAQAAFLAMRRNTSSLYDPIAVTRHGQYVKTVTVRDLLLATIQTDVENNSGRYSLKGFPRESDFQQVLQSTCTPTL